MSLREQAVEAMAEVIFHERWPRMVWGAGTSKRYIYLGDASAALDALLLFLTEHTEEWSDVEFQATNSEDPAVVLPIRSIDLKRLVAALRGTTEEQ